MVPLESFHCDKYALLTDPIVDLTFKWLLAKGEIKTKLYREIIDKLKKLLADNKAAFREGKWMIGDGEKIMMCDFFWGRIYTDMLNNENSFLTKLDRNEILKEALEFKAFGDKFTEENKLWINRRERMGQEYNA